MRRSFLLYCCSDYLIVSIAKAVQTRQHFNSGPDFWRDNVPMTIADTSSPVSRFPASRGLPMRSTCPSERCSGGVRRANIAHNHHQVRQLRLSRHPARDRRPRSPDIARRGDEADGVDGITETLCRPWQTVNDSGPFVRWPAPIEFHPSLAIPKSKPDALLRSIHMQSHNSPAIT